MVDVKKFLNMDLYGLLGTDIGADESTVSTSQIAMQINL